MTFDAERSLAMMAAEDGDLLEAERSLSALIARADAASTAAPNDTGLLRELVACLVQRATVHAWAVRPLAARDDLDRAEPMVDRLKPLHRHVQKIALLDLRTRLLCQPGSQLQDIAAARAALEALRHETGSQEAYAADTVELQLARVEQDWPRVTALAQMLERQFSDMGMKRGVHAVNALAARAWLELGDRVRARGPAQAAFDHFDKEGPPDIAAQAALALARAKDEKSAWPLVDRAIGTTEQLVSAQRSVFDQQRYLVEKQQIFEDAFRFALRMGDVGRAWSVAERSKSFALRHAMNQGGWLRAMDAKTAAALEVVDDKLRAAEVRAAFGGGDVSRTESLFLARQQLLQEAMRRDPAVANLHAPVEFDLSSTLRALPPGVGVVAWYWLAEEHGASINVFFAGPQRRPRHTVVRWSHEEVSALDFALRAPFTTRPEFLLPTVGFETGRKLLPDEVLDEMGACDTVLVSPHRQLRKLPVHAIRIGGAGKPGFLVERFAVEVLASLALPFPQHRPPSRHRSVLLLGCEQDGFENPRLADVPPELEDITNAWRQRGHRVVDHALGAASRLDDHLPLRQWSAFDVIHLACHGRFTPGSSLDTTLYLGRDALRASEFFSVRLGTDVVSLSACDTGQHSSSVDGLRVEGDEWLGLALPMFQSGARHLLTSLWRAESRTARRFMREFHAALADGLTPARAHQRACLANRDAPFGFWANWQLAGFPT